MENYTNNTNVTVQFDALDQSIKNVILTIVVTILSGTCFLALVVNIKVFTCIPWIRKPFGPTLKMSLSLALADFSASSLSFLIILCDDEACNPTVYVIIDLLRLTCILATVTHLLGLSLNHYIGIRKPLHYNSILTERKQRLILIAFWLIPTVFVVLLCTLSAEEQFWKLILTNSLLKENAVFLDTFRFRMIFASFLLISIQIIAFCYFRILIIIRKQRKVWRALSRCGSTVWRGRTAKKKNVSDSNRGDTDEQSKLKGNFKAVYTTLLILGSCFIGWVPALALYIFICNTDCCLSGEFLIYLNKTYGPYVLLIRFVDNELLFLKMLANPIIYSIRMKEIQEGTKGMNDAILRCFYSNHGSNSDIATKKVFHNTTSSHIQLASSRIINGKTMNHVPVEIEKYSNELL